MAPIFPFKSRLCSVGLVLLLVLLPLGAPSAQADSAAINPAILVKDINTATRSAEPQFLSAVGNRLLFAADDGINGVNLWATDATGTGAFRLKAIKPLSPVIMSKGVGYFAASDAEHGDELWRTDGTTAGTQLVADINPGTAGSNPHAFVDLDGTLFFFATTDNFAPKLWKSNGTGTGTGLVTERAGSASVYLQFLTKANGKLFMVGNDSGQTFELWSSDGTDTGTVLLKKFAGNSNLPSAATPKQTNIGVPIEPFNPFLTEVNGTVFFRADDGTHGMELWKSDGTPAGTALVTDLKPGAVGSLGGSLIKFQGMLFFSAAGGLWKSDGTAAGTQLVKPGEWERLAVVGDWLFIVGTGSEQGQELWRSNGTTVGTVLVKDINPGSGASNVAYITALNSNFFFAADDGTGRWNLWQSDGTTTGTALVKEITPVVYNSLSNSLTTVGGHLYFQAYDDQHGAELWRSDGTATETILVDDINRQPDNSRPDHFITSGEQIFFTASSNTGGRYFWRSDGTTTSTQRIDQIGNVDFGPDINAKPVNNDLYVISLTGNKLWRIDSVSGAATLLLEVNKAGISTLTTMNNRLFFLVNSFEPEGNGLWQSDGTVAGTQLVKAVQANHEIFVHNNELYFAAFTAETGTELWKSDGTPDGSVLLKDINPGVGVSGPSGFVNLNGTLFFSANDGSHGTELWKTDGTADGTMLVKDIYPSEGSASPRSLLNVNGTLFFNADDGSHGPELWKSDGTVDGTVFVKDIYPGSFGSNFDSPTIVNNHLFFISYNSFAISYEVWVSDGSEAGTFMLKDIHPDNHPSTLRPHSLTAVNDKLVFVANDVMTHGEELWVSDGTMDGTQLLKDINPGSADATPTALTNVNGVVLFGATDGSGQRSLWRSDGTTTGTQLLQNIAPQPNLYDWHQPAFVVAGSNIFFSADDGTNGQELWKIPLTPNQATLKTSSLVSVATDGVGQLQIDYGNQSSTAQRQVSLTAVLHAQLTYLSSSGPVTPTIQGNTLVWQLPDLAPLASGVIDLRVQAPTAPLGARYPVSLTLSTVTGDAAPVQSGANVEVMVAAHSYLPLIKQ